ncbi:hybrid sensor histidine kinase/response regulator [Aliifodinibius sp. S!AR15-10]|uniref:hybrid sensor histidine kinase/response regulator n=1 Tax=Aliifodinibius sp. S!AR15-10 TaxID=2950437 RepID=UPI00285B52B4|nr:hybrid sensor histidine kinase/response regulator [Aliifodinibius sp. S!AR15-10]MDR8393147.1 hybrid sensor histidine kinase/response regulator [Aliifodinibius sp. S!AR15-10]
MEGSIEGKQESDFLILIADDVPKNIQLLGKTLDNRGYRISAVTSGDQVVKTARNHAPDLILLDVMMPGKNGFEVCKELKEYPELSDIPVIFLTARSEEQDIVKGLNLGGADYVKKPFNSGELLARIKTHLSLKEARDQIKHQKRQVQQLSETKEKLYSIIAHDLKNALFGISGLAEILEEDLAEIDLDEEILDSVKMISKSSNTATLILKNLLSWTRFQTDDLELTPEEFSLSEEIQESISLYQTQANRKEVEIRFVSDVEPLIVLADLQMISTVVRNLISNAIKFSNAGDEVTVRLTEGDDAVHVEVADQGIGMPEEIQDTLFNPEERPKRAGTDNEQGTGLGLLLCKEFVEAHRGNIKVESEPGNGTTFRFSIPREFAMQNGQPAG